MQQTCHRNLLDAAFDLVSSKTSVGNIFFFRSNRHLLIYVADNLEKHARLHEISSSSYPTIIKSKSCRHLSVARTIPNITTTYEHFWRCCTCTDGQRHKAKRTRACKYLSLRKRQNCRVNPQTNLQTAFGEI